MREIAVILDGAAERVRRERELTAWLAWHTAALGRVKKFPKLKDVLPTKGRKPERRQTIDEQIAIARQWTAVLARQKRNG
ncbi:MAG TPA: hypothetical protein VFT89_07335 [Rhizobiaceae bacterium]|nr:hypothetical protein [Rhizobiaceae bacterium]